MTSNQLSAENVSFYFHPLLNCIVSSLYKDFHFQTWRALLLQPDVYRFYYPDPALSPSHNVCFSPKACNVGVMDFRTEVTFFCAFPVQERNRCNIPSRFPVKRFQAQRKEHHLTAGRFRVAWFWLSHTSMIGVTVRAP